MPGPWSTMRTSRRPPLTRARTNTDQAGRVAHSVLQQVGEGALELHGVGLDQRQIRIEPELRAGSLGGGADDLLERGSSRAAASTVPACRRERSSSFSNEPGEAGALGGDRGRELAPVLVREIRGAERLARGHHRRQRRAQVVRDRTQDRGLELVRAPQRGRLVDHLARELLAIERRGQQRAEAPARRARAAAAGASRGDRERAAAGKRNRDAALVTRQRAHQHDRGGRQLKRGGDRSGRGGQRRRHSSGVSSSTQRQLRAQVGLAATLVGLRRPGPRPPRPRSETATAATT